MDAALLPALGIALIGGLISFISPCVLPIVPPYLAYMGGVSVDQMSGDRAARGRVMLAALFFVLGLSTVFIIMGGAASWAGGLVLRNGTWFNTVAALVVMLFGMHFLHIVTIPFLNREARIEAGDKGGSAFGAYLLGLAFAFGWTPCLGPILSTLLSLASQQGEAQRGGILLAAYALGLGVPFLLVAAFFPSLTGVMAWMKRHMAVIERVMGLLLWTVGLMMLTGAFSDFSYWLLELFPALASVG